MNIVTGPQVIDDRPRGKAQIIKFWDIRLIIGNFERCLR